MVSQAELTFKGCCSLVSGLSSFFRDGMCPFKFMSSVTRFAHIVK